MLGDLSRPHTNLSRRQDRCYDPHFPDGETLPEPLHDSLRATQGVQAPGLRPQPRATVTPASRAAHRDFGALHVLAV